MAGKSLETIAILLLLSRSPWKHGSLVGATTVPEKQAPLVPEHMAVHTKSSLVFIVVHAVIKWLALRRRLLFCEVPSSGNRVVRNNYC